MPFHIPHHRHHSSEPQSPHDSHFSLSHALYSAGHTLTSIGHPTHDQYQQQQQRQQDQIQHQPWPAQPLPLPFTSTQNALPTTASDQNRSHTNGNTSANSNATVIPYRSGPSQYENQNQYSGLRRSLTIGRQPDDPSLINNPPPPSAMSDLHNYGAPPAYGAPLPAPGDQALSINIDPSTPQQSSSAASLQISPIPGTLQPGLVNRPAPAPLGANSAAPSLPTLPQISTQLNLQPSLSARPSTMNHSHSYSRSSPGVMDQPKYKPFTNHTPEQGKYSSTSSNYVPSTPLGPSSYSPLALADVRLRGDTNFSDMPFSPNVAQESDVGQYPRNSNYTAPWPIYAVDWCKWPPRSNNSPAGKIAMGSYLEDNHNYVRIGPSRLPS